jgi:2-keto-4-pentenoate hydratase/2-oxohepta-3-ene-1,7-dioic acid hydratase in catechol pathway
MSDRNAAGLVRFVPKSNESLILIGQPIDEEIDVGAAVRAAKEIQLAVFSGSSVLDPGHKTDQIETISRVLSPLAQDEVGTIRCIGLNYVQHAKEVKMSIPSIPTLFLCVHPSPLQKISI